jgi:O-antigen/teichoic acid export membrane protein
MGIDQKEILLKSAYVFGHRVFGYGFGFLFTWLVSRWYGASGQGVFAIAFLFLSVGTMVAKMGIETSIVKWIANASSSSTKKSIYYETIVLASLSSLIVSVGVFFFSDIISIWYNKPTLSLAIRVSAFAIPFLTILDVSANYFKGDKKIGLFGLYFYTLKFIFPLISLILAYIFSIVYKEIPIVSYAIGISICSILITIHLWVSFKKTKKEKTSKMGYKFVFLESYPMMISSAIVLIMGWSDVFILGFFVDEPKIGIYSVCVKVATVVAFVYNAIATIVTPKIAQFYAKRDYDLLQEMISKASKIMLLTGIPIFITLFIFSKQVLGFFGNDFSSGTPILRILLCAQLINVLTGPVGPLFQMTGLQKKLQSYIVASLIINISLSLLLIFPFKMNGVAIASAIGMVFWNISGLLYLRRNREIRTYYVLPWLLRK